MSPVTYTVAVDRDDDGAFTGTGEDISADVVAVRWRLGMAAPYDLVAAPSEASIIVRSPTRAYSPEAGGLTLRPGKPVRIQSHDGGATRTHFTGFIHAIIPQPGDQGGRLAVIQAGGPERQLSQTPVRLPPQVSARADQILAAVLDSVSLRRKQLKGRWVLDVMGQAELGANTTLPAAYPRSLESGVSVFVYAGDTWGDGLAAAEAVEQIAASERGRFFVSREGALVFYNRHHTLLNTTAAATFSDSMDGLDYVYGADVVNQVSVVVRPRALGAPASVLWRLSSAQAVAPGESGRHRIVAGYRDSDGRPMGAVVVIAPESLTDYQANTRPDGLGSSRTAQLNVRLVEAGIGAATLEIINTGSEPIYLLAGMQLRGTPLTQGDPVLLEQADATSQTCYGYSRLRLDLPALGSLEEAEQVARFELARRKDPRGMARQLHLNSPAHRPQILARTLFDRISLHETQTGHSADYFIVAEAHEVELAGARHRATWTLEPAAASAFWVIAVSLLDGTTRLAY